MTGHSGVSTGSGWAAASTGGGSGTASAADASVAAEAAGVASIMAVLMLAEWTTWKALNRDSLEHIVVDTRYVR